uniref:Right-handed parallel beta-helix repeat-containing protein n=1 Tax=candidate division WOR-3 bacterium TaxID=2052148 RepID=A0A7V3PSJ8_UNCW3
MVRKFWLFIFTILFFACPGPDTLPPRVHILFPADGDTVAGTSNLQVFATDNQQVQQVQFLVDDSLVGVDSLSADSLFECPFTASLYPAGSVHTFQAVAFDRAGNCDSSPNVEFITFPLPGTYHQGTISTAETWTAAGNPHYVNGTLRIEALVTVEPGVIVLLGPSARITVGNFAPAGIQAQGSDTLPIRFTAQDTLNPWQTIEFNRYTDPAHCILRNCVIEFGGTSNALLSINNGWLGLENCRLQHSRGAGISTISGGFTIFRNNIVTGCTEVPLLIHPQSIGSIGTGNQLTGNGLDRIKIIAGTVERSTTWPNSEIPYLITGSITVASDSYPVLTISPGCSLLFTDSAKLRVGVGKPGALFADGSYGQIVFTGVAHNHWPGIEFWNNTVAERTLLKNCLIDRAGNDGVAAILNYVPIKITGTRIQYSASAGIYCIGTGFGQFEYNTITDCATYPLHIEAPSVGTLGQQNWLGGNIQNYIDVTGGVITQDAVWHDQGAPFRINGSVDVGSPFAPTLYLNSGVKIQFAPNCGLRIGELGPGKLIATGIPESIRFIGDTTQPGSWRAIEFAPLTGTGSKLDHCQIFFGSGGGATAEVIVRTCAPQIINNEIAYSAKCCIALFNSPLEPDQLRQQNSLHDWGDGYDDIYDEGP